MVEHGDPGRESGGVKSWVTSRVGTPIAGEDRAARRARRRRVWASSAASGSSSSSTSAAAQARARARPAGAPPRQLPGGSREVGDPQALEQGRRAFPSCERDVLGDGEVREQRVVLEDVTDRTRLGRQVDVVICPARLAAEQPRPRSGRCNPATPRSRMSFPRPRPRERATRRRPRVSSSRRSEAGGRGRPAPVHARILYTRSTTALTSRAAPPPRARRRSRVELRVDHQRQRRRRP